MLSRFLTRSLFALLIGLMVMASHGRLQQDVQVVDIIGTQYVIGKK